MSANAFSDEFDNLEELHNEKDERRDEYARKHTKQDIRENEIDPIRVPKGKPVVEEDWTDWQAFDDDFDDMPPPIWEVEETDD